MNQQSEGRTETKAMVKCGDCKWFVRDGNCSFLASPEGRDPKREFGHAPFWVWSDCYSDKEQVFKSTESCCPTFAGRASKTGAE